MAEKPQDFNLSPSVIAKLIRDALPENVIVEKDAKSALNKATSIFILYATSCANRVTTGAQRDTLTAQDVFDAFNEMGFIHFLPHLQQCYDSHKKEKARKERHKARQKKLQNASSAMTTSSIIAATGPSQVLVTESTSTVDNWINGDEEESSDEQMMEQ